MQETSFPLPSAPPRSIFTVRQFSERHPAFSQTALRRLIYYASPRRLNVGGSSVEMPANGFEHSLVRVGRRVLIDEARFFEWIESQQRREGGAA
jgi:hypothetical protein